MKKKILFVLLLSLAAAFLFADDSKGKEVDKKSKVEVTGYIVSKGNMPFVFPAVKADDGQEYLFVCTKKQAQKLLKAQGQRLKLTFNQTPDNILVLTKYKKI